MSAVVGAGGRPLVLVVLYGCCTRGAGEMPRPRERRRTAIRVDSLPSVAALRGMTRRPWLNRRRRDVSARSRGPRTDPSLARHRGARRTPSGRQGARSPRGVRDGRSVRPRCCSSPACSRGHPTSRCRRRTPRVRSMLLRRSPSARPRGRRSDARVRRRRPRRHSPRHSCG